jgi:SAM-dependent methyltransferase
MHPPTFDRLAPLYRWLEWATYGGLLQWCRTAQLERLAPSRRALIVGDGDGRFLAALLRANRSLTADSLDASPRMIALARREVARVPGGLPRVRFVVADVRTDPLPSAGYDLVVTNFLLDCFTADELAGVVRRLSEAAAPAALWVVGDFGLPESRWKRWAAQLALAGMYTFFRIVTRISAGELVDPKPALRQAGFTPVAQRQRLAGFLVSTLWERPVRADRARSNLFR